MHVHVGRNGAFFDDRTFGRDGTEENRDAAGGGIRLFQAADDIMVIHTRMLQVFMHGVACHRH